MVGESYYRRVCEDAGVALIATDRDLYIRVWNAASVRLFDAGADRMLGRPISAIIPPERRGAAERALRRTIETGETSEFAFPRRTQGGRRLELAGTIAPLLSESGARIGTVTCIRDITRFVVQQEERYEGRKLTALGQMAGMIAHHFNNIVGGVITSIDFATASDDPAHKSRVLEQAGFALTRATTLIHGLLVFAEGDPRSSDLADYTEILNDCADCVEHSIEGRNIELVVNIPKLPILPIPRVQLMTVLHNITQNALDAMPDGGTLRIDAALTEDRIVTEITDTGVGLEESLIPRIFEPFWSTKAGASSTPTSATGLGLAVAHGILQVMGGSIDVSSEPNKGSSFRVSVPRPGAD